ncbi:MAG: hypothetical protein M1587_02815, partial [Thaumarchaeota archaeon]|nr:hypothetical protein [Nitrososphaerota archaeon]
HKEYPDAPLALQIKEQRNEILEEQKKKGIHLNSSLLSDTVILKRLVMKRCVYGVDWNFLAVELAKLSLWLDSFTIGTPLTFLDHHIRCGDSLIGLWLESLSKKTANDTLEKWMDEVSIAGSGLFQAVSMPADLTKQEVEQSRKAYLESRERMYSFQVILDALCAGMLDENASERLPRNLPLVAKTASELEKSKTKKKPDWWPDVEKAVEIARKFKAFHWEIEFPDAFGAVNEDGDSHHGFDLVLTNPPWEGVKPDDDDFFEVYYPRFRNLSDKQAKKKVIKSLLENKEIARTYVDYKDNIEKRSSYFKECGLYTKQGTGDPNLWKLFVERILSLLSDTGTMAIVLDSGIVIHEGAKQLRETLFQNRIRLMYEFENIEEIFKGVHPQDKFVLLVVDKGNPSPSFPAAFYLHKVSSLVCKSEQEKFIEMPIDLVAKCAPETLSIPEVRNKEELDIIAGLYEGHPLLSDPSKGWAISLVNEFHMTNDSGLFRKENQGWPLFEGKHFHQFIPNFGKTVKTVDREEGLERTARIREYAVINRELHNTCRLAYRSTGNSTNVRVMIACILPPQSFSSNSNIVVVPKINDATPRGEEYASILCYLAGVMNSFVFDFLVRKRITRNLNFFYIYQTPVPSNRDKETAKRIAEIAARLSLTDSRYSRFATLMGMEAKPISMKDRIKLTGELNILVAKHYRLSASQLRTILDTFDVVEEDREIHKLGDHFEWTEELIRKLNGEVRKYVLDNLGLLEVVAK